MWLLTPCGRGETPSSVEEGPHRARGGLTRHHGVVVGGVLHNTDERDRPPNRVADALRHDEPAANRVFAAEEQRQRLHSGPERRPVVARRVVEVFETGCMAGSRLESLAEGPELVVEIVLPERRPG